MWWTAHSDLTTERWQASCPSLSCLLTPVSCQPHPLHLTSQPFTSSPHFTTFLSLPGFLAFYVMLYTHPGVRRSSPSWLSLLSSTKVTDRRRSLTLSVSGTGRGVRKECCVWTCPAWVLPVCFPMSNLLLDWAHKPRWIVWHRLSTRQQREPGGDRRQTALSPGLLVNVSLELLKFKLMEGYGNAVQLEISSNVYLFSTFHTILSISKPPKLEVTVCKMSFI